MRFWWRRRPRWQVVIVGLESTVYEMETGEPVGVRTPVPWLVFRDRAAAERFCAQHNANDPFNLITWVVERVN